MLVQLIKKIVFPLFVLCHPSAIPSLFPKAYTNVERNVLLESRLVAEFFSLQP